MNIKHIRTFLIACSLVVAFQPLQGLAQQNSEAAKTSVQHPPTEHDGQHDFDFEIGTWKIHLKRLDRRLTGSTTWVEFDGTSVTRKVWDGRADLEEFETDSPAGGHIERYDPASIRSPNPSVEPLLGHQQDWRHGPAHDRRIQEWTRRIFRHGTIWPQWSSNPGSICLVGHHPEFGPL